MSDITISVIQPPSTTINVGVDETTLIQAGISFPTHSVTHISGGSDELNHNLLAGLQGGSGGQYYHLSSGEYFNLVTGQVIRPDQTGLFYPNDNPSGYITGIDLSNYATADYVTGVSGSLQTQITTLNNQTGSYVFKTETGNFIVNSQTGQFYSSNNPSGYTATGYVTGISGNLQTQITTLNNQTGNFYPRTNPSGYITGINNLVFTTGNQTISGAKTFSNNLTVNGGDLFVNTSNNRVGINTTTPTTTLDVNGSGLFRSGLNVNLITSTGSDFYLSGKNNATEIFEGSFIGGFVNLKGGSGTLVGGYVDLKGGDNGGYIRIQGGDGINQNANLPVGPVLINSFSTEFNKLNTYSSNVIFWKTGLSTIVENARISQDSISINNNLLITGNRPIVNGTGILLSGEATTQAYVTGISGGLQTQITTLNNATGSYVLNSQTGVFYPRTNPSGYITGVDLSFSGNYYTKDESESRYVNTTGAETILGNKTFHDNVYINNLYVTGLETIVNTTNTNVASNYITLNLTGGAVDGGIFFITGSGLTGINDSGAIIGFDHSDEFKFGISTRASDLSTLNTIASVEQMTGISGGLQTQISTLNNQIGSYVLKTETGNFITNSQTGQFYPNSNPSGFITGIDLSSYATQVYVTGISGDLQAQITDLNNSTGQFYLNSNPSGYITGVDLSTYATIDYTTGISGELQTQITNLSNATGSYVLNSQTGDFYPNSNPSGFITGINDLVYTTGDQTINGIKTFTSRPTLNGTGILLSGEAAQLPETIIYSTGDQNISGIKNFLSQPTISGNPIATISDPVRTTLIGDGIESGFAISGASELINPSALIVAIDGAMQEPIVDYVVNTGSIFFTSPLPSGSKAVVVSPNNFYQVGQVVPSDGSVTSSKLDNSIEINNLTVANNLTTTNDFTLNGSFTGNSTLNNLPNQTLVNSGSILTRDLMTMFLEKDIYYFSPASFSTSTTISGAQASVGSNFIFLRGNTTTQASPNNLAMATVGTHNADIGFMSISNSSSYVVGPGNRGGAAAAYSILDYRQRVILQFELTTNFRHVASNHNFFARLGSAGGAINTNTGEALPGTGISIGDSYVAMLMETGSIRLVTNKNLATPTESPNQLVSPILTYLTPFNNSTAKFSLSVYNGTADLYIGNKYIGSQTGCPTHVGPFSNGIAFGCNSLAPTTTVGAGYVVSNIKIITLPN